MNFLERFESMPTGSDKRTILFRELKNDEKRTALYDLLREEAPFFSFPSRVGGQTYLLTRRDHVIDALKYLSVKPYERYGSGRFVLALEDPDFHASRHKFLADAMELKHPGGNAGTSKVERSIAKVSDDYLAIPRNRGDMEVAHEYARMVILEFVRDYFGIPQKYHYHLDRMTRATFIGFVGSFYARHFVPVNAEIAAGEKAAGQLGGLLIKLLRDGSIAEDSVIGRMLATKPATMDIEELMIMVAGSINGVIDNAIAGVCNALDQLFKNQEQLNEAIDDAHQESTKGFRKYADEAMRLDPPAPFLPRYYVDGGASVFDEIDDKSDVILCIGAAARHCDDGNQFKPGRSDETEFLFGYGAHACAAGFLGKTLITLILKRVLQLPGVQRAAGDEGKIDKKWGAITTKLNVSFNRRLAHSPLNVVMNIKEPTEEHAEKLRALIRLAAPRIVSALDTVGTVHYARFLFLENDTKLALLTTYDGDLEVYLNDFIEVVGDLFDALMEHLQGAPPIPIRQHRREFIETVEEHNLKPAEGFFYSAYPDLTVKNIRPASKRARERQEKAEKGKKA